MLEPVKVPQNVYVEDRIIGPVTLRHLIILGIGAGISYAIYALLTQGGANPGVPLTILAWSPTLVAAAFAFVKINDISLTRMILLMIEGSGKPSVRAWAPHAGFSINIVTKPTKSIPDDTPKVVRGSSKLMELNEQMERERERMEQEHEEEHGTNSRNETNDAASLPVEPGRVTANGTARGTGTLDGIHGPDSPFPSR